MAVDSDATPAAEAGTSGAAFDAAEHDLTLRIVPFLDRHMAAPLIEFLISTKVLSLSFAFQYLSTEDLILASPIYSMLDTWLPMETNRLILTGICKRQNSSCSWTPK